MKVDHSSTFFYIIKKRPLLYRPRLHLLGQVHIYCLFFYFYVKCHLYSPFSHLNPLIYRQSFTFFMLYTDSYK